MGVVFGIHDWAQDAWAVAVLGNLWNDHEWTRRQYSHLFSLDQQAVDLLRRNIPELSSSRFDVLIRMLSFLVTTLSDQFRKKVAQSSEGESVEQW